MDKLQMKSKDLVDENINKIAKLFPDCITEGLDKNGKLTTLIDFDLLKQELSHDIVDGNNERYALNWPDKNRAILNAYTPISNTLRPIVTDEQVATGMDSTGLPYISSGSVGNDGTIGSFDSKNLYIEGDNLDVIKLLRETYLGKIKMIYIDPPYNTGNDFIYNDSFATRTKDYLEKSNQISEQGNRMVTNNESNGRFHTNWLNMIFPRLKMAKDLLTDDGVIFISMADNEIANLLKICEEIFGKNNIELFVWKKKGGAGNTEKIIGVLTEYIVCCFKNKKPDDLNYQIIKRTYNFEDEKGKYNLEGLEKTNLGGYERKSMQFAIIDPKTNKKFYPAKDKRWTIGENTAKQLIAENKIFFDYNTGRVKRIKRSEDYDLSENVYYNLLTEEGSLAVAKDECAELLGNREFFDTPKPVSLIKKLIEIGSKKDSIILDFFSGSATTAHAVMTQNAEDGGNRHFIMVQMPEKCDEKSEAYKAGYKNICEIGKERIRRAGTKILENSKSSIQNNKFNKKTNNPTFNVDIGFRMLKLDSSCLKDVYYQPDKMQQNLLPELEDNIKDDRTSEDLLFQVMLDIGILLSSEIKNLNIQGKKVFNVDNNTLVCCFEKDITDNIVEEIAKLKPKYAVFRDSSISSDSVAVNFEQIFEAFSHTTIRKVF